jgi:hypothetical protein
MRAGKKLLDTRHPAFKAVTGVRTQIGRYWKAMSLPFTEPGVRLLRQDDIEAFNQVMSGYRQELAETVTELDRHYRELCAAARSSLGRLFHADDYPPTLSDSFAVEWSFPAVEPPSYLQRLHPEIFAQEQARVARQFEEAVRLAEEAFIAELQKLVAHLADRLSPAADGQAKVFRDSAIDNLTDFFETFRHLNIRSNADLDGLVARAQQIVEGVDAQDLREQGDLRARVAGEFAQLQGTLDGLMVDRPRRRILRSGASANGVAHAAHD